jgi:excisionase family DNA binding protein
MERYVCVKDVASFFSVSPKTIYDWAERRFIPHYRLPKGLRFKLSEVDRWMKRRKVK